MNEILLLELLQTEKDLNPNGTLFQERQVIVPVMEELQELVSKASQVSQVQQEALVSLVPRALVGTQAQWEPQDCEALR